MSNLNTDTKSIKLLENNIGKRFHNIGFDDNFLDMTSKTQVTKGKINQTIPN